MVIPIFDEMGFDHVRVKFLTTGNLMRSVSMGISVSDFDLIWWNFDF